MSPTVPVYLWGLVVDKYPVTAAEMRAAYPRYQSPWPRLPDDVPATGVSWYEANVYALRRGMRLPSALEWLVAAGARDGRRFPWGNEEDPSRCNCREGGRGRPTPVHAFDGRGD